MFSSTYDEAALSEITCREWFQSFKSGDFDVEDRHGSGKVKIFEDSELEALLAVDSCETQEHTKKKSIHSEITFFSECIHWN